MNDETFLNERVQVLVVYKSDKQLCMPIKFKRSNGREIVVTELGLSHPTTAGKRMIHIFDVTDGQADYRLEFDSERLTWHLTREGDRYE